MDTFLTGSKPCGISHVAVVTADLDRYRTFYEGTVGLDTALVLGSGAADNRQAVVLAGDAMLHVFEVDHEPVPPGTSTTMFERGRLDHVGFTLPDEKALTRLRNRLVAVGASSGDIRPLGPLLSVRYQDPDGFEGEFNCFNPHYDPSVLREQDEVVDPRWFEHIRGVLRAGCNPAEHTDRRTSP